MTDKPRTSFKDRPFAPPLRMTEDQIQGAVFDHIRRRGVPRLFAFHPKNGGSHQASAVARMVNAGLGVVSGVPDVILVLDGRIYGLELKTERGRLSDDQREVHSLLCAAGAEVAVAYGLDQAIRFLEAWGLLRGAAAMRGAA